MIALRPGMTVSWSTWCGTATVVVESAGPTHVTYRSTDGHRESVHASAWHTLADQTKGWRLATPCEARRFAALARLGEGRR